MTRFDYERVYRDILQSWLEAENKQAVCPFESLLSRHVLPCDLCHLVLGVKPSTRCSFERPIAELVDLVTAYLNEEPACTN